MRRIKKSACTDFFITLTLAMFCANQIPEVINDNASVQKNGKSKEESKERWVDEFDDENDCFKQEGDEKHENRCGTGCEPFAKSVIELAFFIRKLKVCKAHRNKKHTDHKQKISRLV